MSGDWVRLPDDPQEFMADAARRFDDWVADTRAFSREWILRQGGTPSAVSMVMADIDRQLPQMRADWLRKAHETLAAHEQATGKDRGSLS